MVVLLVDQISHLVLFLMFILLHVVFFLSQVRTIPLVGVSQFLYIKVSIHFTDAQNEGKSWSLEVREEKRGDASLGRKPFFFYFLFLYDHPKLLQTTNHLRCKC